jgi:aerobic carbon-monoxide dehydrogenase medium subunit
MIPARFDYRRAGSAGEAVALLSEYPGAKLLAGGHSLLPLMRLRLAVPSMLIDIGSISDLCYVRDEGDHVSVGALTRHRDLELSEVLRQEAPLLCYVAGQVGDPQVRHRGTIGGSLAHGDPASDLPAAVLALDGTLVVEGPDGRREIAAGDFFAGFLETAVAPDEVLTEVRLPKARGGWSFQKFNRRAQDWATVGVVAVAADGAATGGPVRVALVNMGLTPLRAAAVEDAVAGGAGPAEAARLASEGTEPPSDLNASAEFRRHLASVLVRRALEEAMAAETGEGQSR